MKLSLLFEAGQRIDLYGFPVRGGSAPIDRLLARVAQSYVEWDITDSKFMSLFAREFHPPGNLSDEDLAKVLMKVLDRSSQSPGLIDHLKDMLQKNIPPHPRQRKDASKKKLSFPEIRGLSGKLSRTLNPQKSKYKRRQVKGIDKIKLWLEFVQQAGHSVPFSAVLEVFQDEKVTYKSKLGGRFLVSSLHALIMILTNENIPVSTRGRPRKDAAVCTKKEATVSHQDAIKSWIWYNKGYKQGMPKKP